MADKTWSEILAEQARADGAFLQADTALPPWVKYLMAMQLDAVFNHPRGVRHYGRRAREAGATPEQVVEAIALLRMFGGRPAMVTGVEGLRDG